MVVRRVLGVCAILLLCLPMWAFANDVLVVLPPNFHCAEVNETARQLSQYGLGTVVVGVDVSGSCLSRLPGNAAVKPLSTSDVGAYAAVVFEGYGWYSDWFLPVYRGQPAPSFAPVVSDLVKSAIDHQVPLAMAGPGGYAYLASGHAYASSTLAVYDCPEYYGYCYQLGVTPVIAQGDPPAGSPQYGPDADLIVDDSKGTLLISSSIPTTWYGLAGGDLVVEHYQTAYDEFFSAVADAAKAPHSPATPVLMTQGPDHLTVHNPGTVATDITVSGLVGEDTQPTIDTPITPGTLPTDLQTPGPAGEDTPSTIDSTIGPGAAATYEIGHGQYPGAVVVESSQPVAVIANQTIDTGVEGSMSYQGMPLGGDTVTSPATRWTFPGCRTDGDFSTWFYYSNPSAVGTDVAVTYRAEGRPAYESTFHLPAHDSYAAHANDAIGGVNHFSAVVESTSPILVVRQASTPWDGASVGDVDFGMPEASKEWWLPIGRTDSDEFGTFQTSVVLQTIGRQEPTVTVEFTPSAGPKQQVTQTLPQDGTVVIDVEDLVGQDPWIGIYASGDAAFYAERQLTWTQHDTGQSIVDTTRGVGQPSTHWTFPVRFQGGQFEVINPGVRLVNVSAVFHSGAKATPVDAPPLLAGDSMKLGLPAPDPTPVRPAVLTVTSDAPVVVRNGPSFTVRGPNGIPLTFEFDTSPAATDLSQTWYAASTFTEDLARTAARAIDRAPFAGSQGAVQDEFDILNHLMDQTLGAIDMGGITLDQAEAVLREIDTSFAALLANMPDVFGVPFATWFEYLARMRSAFDYGWDAWSPGEFEWHIDAAQRAKELLERHVGEAGEE